MIFFDFFLTFMGKAEGIEKSNKKERREPHYESLSYLLSERFDDVAVAAQIE